MTVAAGWQARRVLIPTCAACALLLAFRLWAQETTPVSPTLHIAIGGEGIPGGVYALGRKDVAYQLTYETPNVIGNFGLELSYQNEGHLVVYRSFYQPINAPLDYRDNFAIKLDRWSPMLAHCRVGAAAGIDTYFDTTTREYRSLFENRHGVGLQVGLAGQCYLIPSLAIEFLAGRSFNIANYDSTTLLLGLAYSPKAGSDAFLESSDAPTKHYVEVVGGSTVIDSFQLRNEKGIIWWLTYGQALRAPFAIEYSFLDEDISTSAANMHRQSLSAELVVAHEFGFRWLQLFAGIGPALAKTNGAINQTCNGTQTVCDHLTPESYTQINFLYEYGLRVWIANRASLTVKIGRVGSSSGRTDTDIAAAGFGVRF
jgi:hypothetical protein